MSDSSSIPITGAGTGAGDDSFLTTYGSHIAAVVIGVVVTLAAVQSFSSSTKTSSSSSSSTIPSSNQKKKKRNNKKKGKDGETTAANGTVNGTTTSNGDHKNREKAETMSSKAVTPPVVKIVDPVKAVKEEDMVVAMGMSTNNKKKNNKKKKNGNANTAVPPINGNATTNHGSDAYKENGVALKKSPRVSTSKTTTATAATSFYDYDPQQAKQEEEVWEVIPDNKSKKKKKKGVGGGGNSQTTTSMDSTAAAAAASAVSTKVTEVVSIDASKVGIIIGPKGATMLAISAATGCKLDVQAPPKDVKPNPRSTKPLQATVVISEGTSQDIAKAKQAILELAASGYATLLQADTFGEQSLSVHPKVLSEIVGPGGRTIQAIQTALNVKITIPKTDWKPNTPQLGNLAPTCKVGIAGDNKVNVREAKSVLQHLLKYHHHDITHPGMIHQEVHVPQEFFHCVIGPRGSEIKHIRGNFKVDVYMPTTDGPTDNVIVVGLPNHVERAVRYIEILMERDSEQKAQKYNDEYYG